jgi:hypothetical protein
MALIEGTKQLESQPALLNAIQEWTSTDAIIQTVFDELAIQQRCLV